MSLVVAAYVPQPAVIWLSREPKRQRTDQQGSGPTNWNSFRDATPTLRQFQRWLKTSLFRLACGRDLTAHSWLYRLSSVIHYKCTNWTELNWIDIHISLHNENKFIQALSYTLKVCFCQKFEHYIVLNARNAWLNPSISLRLIRQCHNARSARWCSNDDIYIIPCCASIIQAHSISHSVSKSTTNKTDNSYSAHEYLAGVQTNSAQLSKHTSIIF